MQDSFIQSVQGWHEFATLTGSAAATLVGLLFVALSLNIEVFRRGQFDHTRALARRTFFVFLYVLTASAMILIPGQRALSLGLSFLGVGVFGLGNTVKDIIRARKTRGERTVRAVVRPFLLSVVGLAGLVVIALRLVLLADIGSLDWLPAVLLVLLGSASQNAWNLLMVAGDVEKSGPP